MPPTLREIAYRDEAVDALEQLAESGRLSVTALLQLPPRAKEICGQVIMGQREQRINSPRGTFTNPTDAYLPLPPALAAFQVELEAINAWLDPEREDAGYLVWTDGSAPRGYVSSRGQGALGLDGHDRVELISGDVRKAKLDEKNRARVSVRDAWLLLKRAGENVVPAADRASRKLLWRVREVPREPAPEQPAEPKPRARSSEKRV